MDNGKENSKGENRYFIKRSHRLHLCNHPFILYCLKWFRIFMMDMIHHFNHGCEGILEQFFKKPFLGAPPGDLVNNFRVSLIGVLWSFVSLIDDKSGDMVVNQIIFIKYLFSLSHSMIGYSDWQPLIRSWSILVDWSSPSINQFSIMIMVIWSDHCFICTNARLI